ncbi:MAG: acyl-CoA dehydrogenase family protein [Chloroherpetonaceae bacterium]|nr:acyl-CoA/acyl-ACP dehydrogenase [Chthonomonadaceae bacterium]MDW8208155.1 acyl-CoA dehydrogenase family protein [Chloroherpetonaceae bacterium]
MLPEPANRRESADPIGVAAPEGTTDRYADDAAILAAAREVAATVLGPAATQSDLASGPNVANFRALAEAGLLGLTLPRAWGGLGASTETQREYTEILASYCGVTTFVQAQHHGPSRMILGCPNDTLKRFLLPDLASGRRMCAISFAHLRRPGPPVLRAEPVAGGYRLYGKAPWVTGYGLMDQVVFGATLPDGRFVYLWSPFHRDDFAELFADIAPPDGHWGTLHASPPLALCAMNASATVEITLDGWFIPEDHWLQESDRETMRRNDCNGVLQATAMPMGCAAGSVRLLNELAEQRALPAIRRAARSLSCEWEEVKAQVREWSQKLDAPDFFVHAVRIRAHSIVLAVRAAHAAVAAASGSANLLTHPAQRLLREALFYTVQAQTQEVMDATLGLLEHPAV